MSEPRVSVVLAVRDGARTLDAALDSVLGQEGIALELIAVDDGSTDSTSNRLLERSRSDSRLRVLRTEGEGLTPALRLGCAEARAPFVARQDVGDESLPGRLVRQAAELGARPRLALVSCFTEVRAPRGELLSVEQGRAWPGQERPMFAEEGAEWPHVGPTSHGSAMFRREHYERVGGYRLEFPLGQDWDLWLRLGELGTYLTVPEVLYRRRLDARSSSFGRRKLQLEFGRASTEASRRRLRGDPEEPALARARELAVTWRALGSRSTKRSEALGWYHFGEVLRQRGDPAARAYLLDAVRTDPTLARAWVRLAQCLARRTRVRTVPSGQGNQ